MLREVWKIERQPPADLRMCVWVRLLLFFASFTEPVTYQYIIYRHELYVNISINLILCDVFLVIDNLVLVSVPFIIFHKLIALKTGIFKYKCTRDNLKE